MNKYRKKPIVIEAVQWFKNGDHPEDGKDICPTTGELYEGKLVRYYRHPDVESDWICAQCNNTMHDHGWMNTLEGNHDICPGDWIITGIKGEKYPCKPDIFEQTYEQFDTRENTSVMECDHHEFVPMGIYQGMCRKCKWSEVQVAWKLLYEANERITELEKLIKPHGNKQNES